MKRLIPKHLNASGTPITLDGYNWLDGVTVTPKGNRKSTKQDWREANTLDKTNLQINLFTGNIRKTTGDFAENYVAPVLESTAFGASSMDPLMIDGMQGLYLIARHPVQTYKGAKYFIKSLFKKKPKLVNKGLNISLNNSLEGYSSNIDPIEIYSQRAASKGYNIDDVLAVDLSDPKEKELALKRLYEVNKAAGEPETYEEFVELASPTLDEISKEKGMGWDEFKLAHINKDKASKSFGEQGLPWVKGHEVEHALGSPDEPFAFSWASRLKPEEVDYFINQNNGTEIGARLSQILNFKQIKDARSFDGNWWKNAFKEYLDNAPINNDMTELFRGITNWDALAKWASNPKNVRVATGAATVSLIPKNRK